MAALAPSLTAPSVITGDIHSSMPTTKVANGNPQPSLDSFTPSVTPEEVVASLKVNGGCFIRGLLSRDDLAKIQSDVRPYLDADKPWNGKFFPKETRRVCGLAGKSRTYMEKVPFNPVFWGVCEQILGSNMPHWNGTELDYSMSHPQINSTTVLAINPGARPQQLHRDDAIHHNRSPAISADKYKPGRETAIGMFVAGTRFTKENGATRFVPGSHLQSWDEPPREEEVVYALMEPGDAFIMLASCYHGGSANTTEDEERILYGSFVTKGYLRQEENQYLAIPLEKVKEYSHEHQKRLGFGLSAPFLGWIDLKNPRTVLGLEESLTDDLF